MSQRCFFFVPCCCVGIGGSCGGAGAGGGGGGGGGGSGDDGGGIVLAPMLSVGVAMLSAMLSRVICRCCRYITGTEVLGI